MTTLRIKVTKAVLEESKMCGGLYGKPFTTNCAVALAVRSIFPLANISYEAIHPFGKNERGLMPIAADKSNIILLPQKVTEFILSFDKSTPDYRAAMDELEFEVEIPDFVIEKINIDELRPLLINHPTLELV